MTKDQYIKIKCMMCVDERSYWTTDSLKVDDTIIDTCDSCGHPYAVVTDIIREATQ